MLCCLVSPKDLLAQTNDSIVIKEKPQLYFKLNSRRSFVGGEKISIRGFRLALEFKHKHRVGLGYFDSGLLGLDGGAFIPFFDISKSPRPLKVGVDFGYIAVFYERQLHKTKKWNINFDTQLGFGKAEKTFLDVNNVLLETKKVNKPLIEATFEAKYKILPWVSASAGMGYRYILDGNDEVVRQAFNSPIYVLKVRVSISYFVKRTFPYL